MPKSGTLTIPNAGEDVEEPEILFTDDGNAQCYNNVGRQLANLVQK